MSVYNFYLKNILIFQTGGAVAKLKSATAISLSVSPIAYIAEAISDWTLTNQDYVLFVFGAIMIDHLLGTIIHAFIKKDWSTKQNALGFVIKVGLVIAVGFLFEGINHILQEESFIKNYMIIMLRMIVFLYPAGSAFWNSSIITKGKFPPLSIINKFKRFQENLNVSELKPEEK